jgi:hypothetical protein
MVVRNLKMAIQPEHARRHRLAGWLHDAYVRVALLTGAALLVEAVLAMTALDVRLSLRSSRRFGFCSRSARAGGAADAARSQLLSAWWL